MSSDLPSATPSTRSIYGTQSGRESGSAPDELSTPAREIAKALAVTFLAEGNYEALGSARGIAGGYDAASLRAAHYFTRSFEEGFSGLAVQSVGYTAGAADEKVIIYVTRGSKKALESIQGELEGVRIEARVMGRLKASPAPAMATGGVSSFFEINRRIACGSSCAPSGEGYAGTFGALLRRGADMFALSNNHVFAACNHTAIGIPILAPSTKDTRAGRRAPTAFCQHAEIVELRSGAPGLVGMMELDAAIARILDESQVTSWQGDAHGYDTPYKSSSPTFGLRVKKVGRTTGLTTGVVEALIPTPIFIPYSCDKFSAVVWFTNVWVVRGDGADPFALAGDSGSLVVSEDEASAVGLLFAVNGKGRYGIIMPIDRVLTAFGGATLVSGHGVR